MQWQSATGAPTHQTSMAPYGAAAYSAYVHDTSSAAAAQDSVPPPPPEDTAPGVEQAAPAPDYSQAWAEYYSRVGWPQGQHQQPDPYAAWNYQLSYGQQQSYLQHPMYGAGDPGTLTTASTGTYNTQAYPQQYAQASQATPTTQQAHPAPWQQELQQLPGVGQPAPAAAPVPQPAQPADYSAINAAAKRPFAVRPQMSNRAKKSSSGAGGTGTQAPAYLSIASTKAAADARRKENAAAGSGQGWPESLRQYVQRAFQHCQAEPDREELQQVLKRIITDAQQAGEIWTKDWANMPMPTRAMGAESSLPSFIIKADDSYSSDSSDSEGPYRARISKRKAAAAAAAPSPQKQQRRNLRKGQQQPAKSSPKMKADTRPKSYEEQQRLKERAGRFGRGTAKGAVNPQQSQVPWGEKQRVQTMLDIAVTGEDIDWDSFVVKGTCQQVEKSYFRLTSKPDPASVRPEPVLWQALERLVTLLRSGKPTYFYASDQFKGMRQDCTVQHLRNELAVRIYEAHARSALEYGDIGEYNQCQTQLIAFYADGLPGCQEEFMAYRILYQTVHVGRGEGAALLGTLQAISREAARHPAVAHALQVRQAVCVGDHTRVCKLYPAAPNMGRALLDLLLPKLRFGALRSLVQAFKPSLPVTFLARQLGFQAAEGELAPRASPSIAGLALPGCTKDIFAGKFAVQGNAAMGVETCASWLQKHGGVVGASPGGPAVLDCKASAGSLAIPQDTSAVAHGDANLDVNDFLAHALKM